MSSGYAGDMYLSLMKIISLFNLTREFVVNVTPVADGYDDNGPSVGIQLVDDPVTSYPQLALPFQFSPQRFPHQRILR